MPAVQTKEERIDLRTSKDVKRVIQAAADLLGTTMSAFIAQRSYEAAKRVVSEHQNLALTDGDRDRFLSLLDKPPKPNAALKRLLRGK